MLNKLQEIINVTTDLDIVKLTDNKYKLTIGWYSSMKAFVSDTLEEVINKTWNSIYDKQN